ncbi:MAG: thioredoxin family protein [Alkalispirochaeta sp.]
MRRSQRRARQAPANPRRPPSARHAASRPLPSTLLSAIILVALAVLVVTPVAAQWASDVEDALRRAESTGRPAVVLVTGGAWCDPCTWMEDNSLTSPEIRARLEDEWVALRIPDTDPAWQRWDVERLPTLLYLDPQGQEVRRTVGAVTADSILRTMQEVRREVMLSASEDEVDDGEDGDDGGQPAVASVTGLQTGTRYRIASGTIWNDGGALWFTEDAGLPPRLEEYDRDEAFLYLRDGSSGTLLAITVAEDVAPSLWRWDQNNRRWRELGELQPID